MRKILIAFLMMFALVASAEPAFANEPKDEDIIADVLLVRPLGIVAIMVGEVIFVVSLPVSIPTGNVQKVGVQLLEKPFEFTFVRPIGDFDSKQETWRSKKGTAQ